MGSVTSMKRVTNRNPNCNHNSSQFYNSHMANIKFDKEYSTEEKSPNNDLLWKNSELYSETEEIKALGAVLIKLFSNPKLGEEKHSKSRTKPKTIAEIEEYYDSIDIIVEGKLVNKYSLWTIKKLNPHHKTFLYTLIRLGKITERKQALNMINEIMGMNNKWEKD